MSLGVSLSHSGHVLPSNGRRLSIHLRQRAVNKKKNNRGLRQSPVNNDISQATLDTQAREAIKDLFPKIPDKDIHEIICRAFQKGKDRVGTAVELPLSRRVQLAVVAHIRHVYTNYDRLLRIGTREEARAQIEKPCLDQLVRWRGDDDDDPNAMEEILREVIVIDDDDDDYDDNEDKRRSSISHHDDRDGSVEIISSHAFADEVQTRLVDYGASRKVKDDRQYSPESDDRESAHNARDRQQPRLQEDLPRFDRNGVHHHRWQEALHRHRMNQGPVFTADKEPVLQELASSRTGTVFRSEAATGLRCPERLVQPDSLDHERYQQPQNSPYSQLLPRFEQAKIQDHATGAMNRGRNERYTKIGQVYVPTQHNSHSVGDRQVKLIVSDQEREADDHHHFKPHVEPWRSSPSLEFQDVIRDPRIQYLTRQQERMLPSEESGFQSLKYQQRASFESGPESAVFAHREERNPRIINLRDREVQAVNPRRSNDLLVRSPEISSRQERAYLISRKQDNQLSGCDGSSKFNPHTDAGSHSDRQRPAQMLQTHLDAAGHQPRIMIDGRERPSHHERIEVPLVAPRSVGDPRSFLGSTPRTITYSQSFPTLQHSQKQLPALQGSLRPHVTSHRDVVQLGREPFDPGALDISASSPAKFDVYGQGTKYDIAGQSIRPEYRKRYVEDGQGENVPNQNAYLTSQNDPHDAHVHERSRTGIFLRELGSGWQPSPDGGIFRPVEVQSRSPLKCPSNQPSNPEPAHALFDRQQEMSMRESSGRNPGLEPSTSDNFLRFEDRFKQELAPYDHSEKALALQLVKRTDASDSRYDLTNSTWTPWGRRKAQEIIVID
ncbi:hypothetical protein MMC07_000306 [Pseudocyphellaria aurata]|nr:hypothetical protein [Pseudocyphellaria aurata]